MDRKIDTEIDVSDPQKDGSSEGKDKKKKESALYIPGPKAS